MILKGWTKESKCFSFFKSSEDRPMPLSECPPCKWQYEKKHALEWVMTLKKIKICFKTYSGFAVSAVWICSVLYYFWKPHVFLWRSSELVCECGVRTNSPPHAYHLFHSQLLLHRRFWCCLNGSWCSWMNQNFKNRLVLTQLCEYYTFQCLWSKIFIKGANNFPFPHCFFWTVILHSDPFCTHLLFLHFFLHDWYCQSWYTYYLHKHILLV